MQFEVTHGDTTHEYWSQGYPVFIVGSVNPRVSSCKVSLSTRLHEIYQHIELESEQNNPILTLAYELVLSFFPLTLTSQHPYPYQAPEPGSSTATPSTLMIGQVPANAERS